MALQLSGEHLIKHLLISIARYCDHQPPCRFSLRHSANAAVSHCHHWAAADETSSDDHNWRPPKNGWLLPPSTRRCPSSLILLASRCLKTFHDSKMYTDKSDVLVVFLITMEWQESEVLKGNSSCPDFDFRLHSLVQKRRDEVEKPQLRRNVRWICWICDVITYLYIYSIYVVSICYIYMYMYIYIYIPAHGL